MNTAVADIAHQDHAKSFDSARTLSLSELARHVAHDFNNIWALIFGLTQQLYETPGFQPRDAILRKIDASSTIGLLYSRATMEIISDPLESKVITFDLCQEVRDWSYRTQELLGEGIELSCMVPLNVVEVQFDRNAFKLILLSLLGYVLRSKDEKRWAMIGVRTSALNTESATESGQTVDLMFLCRQADTTQYPQDLQKRINSLREVVQVYGGSVESGVVPGVGVNTRIAIPVAALKKS